MKKIKVIYKKLEFQYKSVLILAIKLIFMGFFVLCLHTHTFRLGSLAVKEERKRKRNNTQPLHSNEQLCDLNA